MPPDFLGSLNITGGLMALVILLGWIVVVRAVTGILVRIVFTVVAASVLLWAIGVAPDVADMLLRLARDGWNGIVAAVRWFFGLFS